MNENEVIDEEIIEEETSVDSDTEDVIEDETPDVPEEEAEEAAEDDDDFEYDEDGNIIIPDDDEDEPNDDDGQKAEDKKGKTDDGQKTEVTPAPAVKADPKDAEIYRLKKELAIIKGLSKRALTSLGNKETNTAKGLAEIVAEANGVSSASVLDQSQKDYAAAEARAAYRRALFEKKASEDLAQLHSLFPETREYKHVRELPEEVRKVFCTARDAGLSVKQAYSAANNDVIVQNAAQAVTQKASKEHLKSNVPKSSKGGGITISKSEFNYYREMFPDLSNKEIKQLYKSVNK